MTVRKITKTTVSVFILITGFVFLRKYYVILLSKLMNFFFHIEEYAPVINDKLFPAKYIGAYFPSLFYYGVIIIIAACMLYVILENKAVFGVLSPFIFPLFLLIIITTAICIDKINMLQLWAIFYFFMLICLHSTFKKIIIYSESTGSYANLKLFKSFFLTVKDAVTKVVSTGITNFNNPIDEVIILFIAAINLLLEVMVLISFIVYLLKFWRLIFLAYLIN
jgi:hypothetical protein